MTTSEVRRINDLGLEALLSHGEVFAVAFMSHTSIPCSRFLSELKAMPEIMDYRLKFVALDVDENPVTTLMMKILAIPTLLIVKEGHEVARYEGLYPRQVLKERIDLVLLGVGL